MQKLWPVEVCCQNCAKVGSGRTRTEKSPKLRFPERKTARIRVGFGQDSAPAGKSRILCREAELRSAAEIETGVVSSSELRIRQISTR
jgi:hypothetical protein